MRSDSELVERALQEGAGAFGPIVDRYRGAVYGIALARLGNYHDAEDVAQKVFIEAYQGLGKLKRPEQLGAWLRTMTARRSIDEIRRRKDTLPYDDELVTGTGRDDEQGDDLREEVLAAIGRLSKKQAETVTLFYMSGYSVAEVAEMQGVPEGTVKGRLHDARRKLKEDMMKTVEQVLTSGKPGEEFGERVLALLSRHGKPPIPPWSKEWKAIGPELQQIGPKGLEGFRKALESPHGPTRLFAVRMLGHTGDEHREERIGILKEALGDPNKLVRRNAATMLLGEDSWERRCKEFVPLVTPLLHDRSRKVRQIVTDALMGFVDSVSLSEAATALAEESIPYIRMQKSALVRAIEGGYAPLMDSPEWHTRWFALRGMMRKPGHLDEPRMDVLAKATRDTKPLVRRSAVEGMIGVLKRAESPNRQRAVDTIVGLLGHRCTLTSSIAAWVLREHVPELPVQIAQDVLERGTDPETQRHLEAIVSRDTE